MEVPLRSIVRIVSAVGHYHEGDVSGATNLVPLLLRRLQPRRLRLLLPLPLLHLLLLLPLNPRT